MLECEKTAAFRIDGWTGANEVMAGKGCPGYRPSEYLPGSTRIY